MKCAKCSGKLDAELKCWYCGIQYQLFDRTSPAKFTGESFDPNPQMVMLPDFKFAESQTEICPHCKRPYDENHVMANITELEKQVNIKE